MTSPTRSRRSVRGAIMAPPDRGDYPQDPDYDKYLATNGLQGNPTLGHNAERLAAWVEWLLRPDLHDYDRTVIYNDGTKREEPGRVTKASQTPGRIEPADLPYESVIEGYYLWQFLNFMVAVSTQEVERPSSVLATSAAAIKNVWWLGDEYTTVLATHFPEDHWTGEAARKAYQFVGDLQRVANQLNKIAAEFHDVGPQYAVIIKSLRRNLDTAAGELVNAFEEKFHSKPEGISLDVMGVVLAGLAAGTVTYMTAGGVLPVVQAAVGAAWSETFMQATKGLRQEQRGTVGGFWWRDLVESYMRVQADNMADATAAVTELNRKVEDLIAQFDAAKIDEFVEEHSA
ncbi:hypothetical protein [Actinophytocola gossypii]|uniref:Uncharacterized protein n=1 Tax=Actinophytocola gossypii TaxID=2812003 RepID=A0ABT2JFA3_9PSEU|nr:hypothetical protein [Actinophytocola gossypii]MCT2586428.1 hypothetical protein [Actinophytocola gossypii]